MPTYGYNFNSGDTVTPERLNNARTITDIVNADISASAEIAVSKLADGAARQLLQTDAAGTGVEWTDNVDVPGTLDVTGAATLDSTLAVTGAATFAPGVVVTGTSSDNAVRITQLGAGNALVVEDSTNPDSTPVVIDASGNTVIGHTAATSIGGGTQPLTINGLGASIVRAAADAVGAVINFCKSRSTSLGAARAIVVSGDDLGKIQFAADNGANLSVVAASIGAVVDGTPGSADMPGRIVFSTTPDGASSPLERMRITNDGLVGIGKTPTTALDVNGTVTATSFAGTASAVADGTITAAKIVDGEVTSAKIANGTIVNDDISASAAIQISKLESSTASTLGVGSIELGHASDTTLSRAAAGRLAVEGVNVVTASSTDTLTNKTLTSPVISSISNTGTLTLPTSTDTLVGRATTDTLTNKTLTAPVISTITNTGTLTLPTSTDTLVGRSTTDTLTNKSIALGSNTITGTKAQFDAAVTDDNFAYTGTANTFAANQTVTGTVTASGFRVGSVQVVGSRQLGWTAPTGTAGRGSFDTESVTLVQLARRVKALIDDLAAHGLIDS